MGRLSRRSVVNLVNVPQLLPTEPELSMMSAISLAPQSADIGMRVGAAVTTGVLVGVCLCQYERDGVLVGAFDGVGGLVARAGGCVGLATVSHTDLTIVEMELDRAEKPDVIAIAFSDDGELTHGSTVVLRIPVPIRTMTTWIPAVLALWNSVAGLSLGLPSVNMSMTFGTPARPLDRTDLALRIAGTMYVPPL
jgi:hypothetical protein